ncbi:MAG: hypothetical protein H7Y06_08680 [Opitutaceae bacterium]|nr:hypothetical protein [Opitutaceae bacterium]
MSSPHPGLYRRITASVPLLVTVAVHVVLIAIAGYFVVSEQLIGKKKSFEASAATESIAQKQVEHRLQVARKAGGSSSSSPVSAARIFSTAENTLQMPAMPDLPSVGASALSGMGFGSGLGATGTGSGYNTGLGSSTLGGSGFMSMSFLGVTNQRASKVVFVVDISPGLMDIRKGGFRAFEILRTEISRLISTLPPANEFNVVLFDGQTIRLFAKELTPATVGNKTAFFDWIKPINASLSSLGGSSIPASSPRWTFSRPEKLKLDPEYGPASWVQGIQAALEQQPDTVFVITGGGGAGQIRYSDETIARRREDRAKQLAEIKASGIDVAGINAARGKAFAKLRAEFDAINKKLITQGKDPFVIQETRRILDADFQAALKRAGITPPKLDTTGWTDKEGNPIWTDFSANISTSHNAGFPDVASHVSRLQYALKNRASLHLFLFTGPSEKTEASEKNLSTLSSKNGGKFNLITTKRLEELTRKES